MATAKTKAQLQAEAKKVKAGAAKHVDTKPTATPVIAAPVDTGINLQHLTHIVTQTTGPAGFCYSPAEVNAPLEAAGLVEVKADMADENGHLATRASTAGIAYVAERSGPFAGAPAAVPAPAWTPVVVAAPAEVAPVAVAVPALAAAVADAAAPVVHRTVTKPPEGGFRLVAGVAPPPVTRGFGSRASVYPFASLEVGISFFVPANDVRPNPAKSLASTVNSATARYAIEDGVDPATGKPKFKKTRTFMIRNIAATLVHPDGSVGGAPWGYPGQGGAAIFRTA